MSTNTGEEIGGMDDGALDYFRECLAYEEMQERRQQGKEDQEEEEEAKIQETEVKFRSLGRHNSTSTVKVSYTMSHPNHSATIEVIARVLCDLVRKGDLHLKSSVYKEFGSYKLDLSCFNDPIYCQPREYYSDSDESDEEDDEILVEEKDEFSLYNDLVGSACNHLRKPEVDKENQHSQLCQITSGPAEPSKQQKNNSASVFCELRNASSSFLSNPKRKITQTMPLPPVARPTTAIIREFLRNMFVTAQCSEECNIICLIYLKRLLEYSGTESSFNPYNWKALTMTALLLASKVWDDCSMVNDDFSIFMPYSLDQINLWEVKFLSGLRYNVRVGASEYAKVYFELRKSAQRSGIEDLPEKEVNFMQAAKLEALTSTIEKRTKQMSLYPSAGCGTPAAAASNQVCRGSIVEGSLRRINSDAGSKIPGRYVID